MELKPEFLDFTTENIVQRAVDCNFAVESSLGEKPGVVIVEHRVGDTANETDITNLMIPFYRHELRIITNDEEWKQLKPPAYLKSVVAVFQNPPTLIKPLYVNGVVRTRQVIEHTADWILTDKENFEDIEREFEKYGHVMLSYH